MAGLTELLRGPVLEVAPRLLGATFTHGGVTVRLTEVEAYDGPDDPGSHALHGRTDRNAVMFGPPGHLYVYFTYGMHFCCNVVVRTRRASPARSCCAPARSSTASRPPVSDGPVAPTATWPAVPAGCARRWPSTATTTASTCADVLVPGAPVDEISTGPRVGLRQAAERPWRFWVTGDPTVSRYVAAKPKPLAPMTSVGWYIAAAG